MRPWPEPNIAEISIRQENLVVLPRSKLMHPSLVTSQLMRLNLKFHE